MGKVLLIGEPMVLFTSLDYGSFDEVQDYHMSVCGAELNVAIGLKRLGHEVSYMSAVGNDRFGRQIIRFVENNGIDSSLIKIADSERTGFMFKGKTNSGDPQIEYCRAGSAASKMSIEMLEGIDLSQFDWLHVTGITMAISENCLEMMRKLVEKARENNIPVSFDPNLRLQLWPDINTMIKEIMSMARISNVFLPGLKEAEILTGQSDVESCLNHLEQAGIARTIMKVGEEGAVFSLDGERGKVRGFRVEEIVDTVGAGDGFAAGLIGSLLDGKDYPQAIRRANGVGAMQLLNPGDNEGLPTEEELQAFMAKSCQEKK